MIADILPPSGLRDLRALRGENPAARAVHVADLYCGAGGTSTGLLEACAESGFAPQLTAINHWPVAIATHTANHPTHRHLCTSIDDVNPRELYPNGGLDILWGSPECIFFSTARGGKPINDQRRASPWCILRWAEALQPPVIMIENVKEFTKWGPLNVKGRPIKAREGETFIAWTRALESQGYKVEWRVLCAADYGDPTTRERLFIQAVRGRRQIIWPEPTHHDPRKIAKRKNQGELSLGSHNMDATSRCRSWVAAKEIIDWSDKGTSIFKRKKPLAPKTLDRIMIGLKKFGLAPFILPHPRTHGDGPRNIDNPLNTVTATSSDMMLCQPYIIPQHRGGEQARDINKPVPTITTTSRGIGVAQPYLVELHGTSTAHNVDKPLGTVTAGGGHFALAEPFLIEVNHGDNGHRGNSKRRAKSIHEPFGTVTSKRGVAICNPFIIGIDHRSGNGDAQRADEPLTTVITKQKHALCEPYLVQYNGSSDAQPITAPMGTVTTRDRFGLCEPIIVEDKHGKRYYVDILFRMLKWRELARAQGFHDTYKFTGKATDIVKQIGNAVPRNLAKALGKSALQSLHSNQR